MFKRLCLALLLALIFALPTSISFAADKFVIDASHTNIGFAVKHMVISKVRGNFKEFEGTIHYDENKVENSKVDVTIMTKSIDTDNAKRDNHLRAADFFNAAKYPKITFTSTKVKKQRNGFLVTGKLKMLNTTKTVDIPFTLSGPIKDPWGNTRLGASGRLTINRQEYGITWSKKLDTGGLVVSDDVEIELDIEAIKQGKAKKKSKPKA